MKKLIVATLIITSFNAQAALDIRNFGQLDQADAKLIIGFGSRHLDKVDHMVLNEKNPAIGFEAWDIQAVYVRKNSWNEKSLYLTYAPDYKVNGYVTLSVQVGVATGYKCSNSVDYNGSTYHNGYCSESGVVALAAATIEYSPFASDFALALSINPEVAMFSSAYSF